MNSSSWNKVHTRLFKLLETAGDPRALDGLDAAVANSQTPSTTVSDAVRASLARAVKTRDLLLARFPGGVPALPDEARASLDAWNAALAQPRAPLQVAAPAVASGAEALLKAVYEDPDDEQRRLVLADVLQELGDPRAAAHPGRALRSSVDWRHSVHCTCTKPRPSWPHPRYRLTSVWTHAGSVRWASSAGHPRRTTSCSTVSSGRRRVSSTSSPPPAP